MASEGFNNRMTDMLSPNLQLKLHDPELKYLNSVFKTNYKTWQEVVEIQKPWKTYEDTREKYLKALNG